MNRKFRRKLKRKWERRPTSVKLFKKIKYRTEEADENLRRMNDSDYLESLENVSDEFIFDSSTDEETRKKREKDKKLLSGILDLLGPKKKKKSRFLDF